MTESLIDSILKYKTNCNGYADAACDHIIGLIRHHATVPENKIVRKENADTAGSSNGRTADFESANAGSSPAPASTEFVASDDYISIPHVTKIGRSVGMPSEIPVVDKTALKQALDFLDQGFTQWNEEKQLFIDAARAYLRTTEPVSSDEKEKWRPFVKEEIEKELQSSPASDNKCPDCGTEMIEVCSGLEEMCKRMPVPHEWKMTPQIRTTPIKCLICNDEAVVIVHAPCGCTCSPNKYQPRCMHHLMRATDTGEEIYIVEDFRIPLSKHQEEK